MSEKDRKRWDARYQEQNTLPEPSAVITALDSLLPRGGRALDIAGGSGRHTIWLAQRGLDVTLVDVSPVALQLAQRHAANLGVSINVQQLDVARQPLPAGPWDLVLCTCFLLPHQLYRSLGDYLRPGGLLILLQPTRRNQQRHARPPAKYLLDEGQLPTLVSGIEIVRYEEGWLADGRHDALLVGWRPDAGQRPPAPSQDA